MVMSLWPSFLAHPIQCIVMSASVCLSVHGLIAGFASQNIAIFTVRVACPVSVALSSSELLQDVMYFCFCFVDSIIDVCS